jgi:hypothetical protein
MTKKEMVTVKYWLGLQDINGYDETGKIYDSSSTTARLICSHGRRSSCVAST